MKRLIAYLVLLTVLSLACATLTQPISDAKNLAATAEAFATSFPSQIPDVQAYLHPEGTPVAEWNAIPIMTQASAGQEFNATTYSFKAAVTASEVQDFYKEKLKSLGWSEPFNVPGGSSVAAMIFQKDAGLLTITVAPSEGEVVVVLNLH